MDAETTATIKRLIQQHRQHECIVTLASDVQLQVEPVHGGYINQVSRVRSADGRTSCIVKIYMDYVKFLGPDVPMERERCQREYLASLLFRSVAPNSCPLPYFCDQTHSIGFLEDLPSHQDWGEVLLSHCPLSCGLKIADMLVSIHSSTHREKLAPPDFQKLCQTFRPLPHQVNFVCQGQFVLPFVAGRGDNKPEWPRAVRHKVEQVIGRSEVLAAAQRVREWMSVESGNCCIHGDLHVHNILYSSSDDSVVLIDTDFARLGPEAYDVALLVCNYVLIFHYHQQLSLASEEHCDRHNTDLTKDMLQLISSTLSRYMDGMSQALGPSFPRQVLWRQIMDFLAVEIIGWISGPPSLNHIDAHPKIQLRCLESGLSILHHMPADPTELTRILVI